MCGIVGTGSAQDRDTDGNAQVGISENNAQIISLFTNSSCNLFPSMAGLRSTMTPAPSSAEIFESAPPFPPLTIAPKIVSKTLV